MPPPCEAVFLVQKKEIWYHLYLHQENLKKIFKIKNNTSSFDVSHFYLWIMKTKQHNKLI
jgi:hypothetical protein